MQNAKARDEKMKKRLHRAFGMLNCCIGVVAFAALGMDALSAAGGPPLVDAVKAGDQAAIRRLARNRAAVNAAEADGTTALHWAARADDAATVRLLLQAGAQVNAANRYGVTPLAVAALNRNAAIVGALLEAGADVKLRLAEDQTILMAAARAGSPDVVKRLLDVGADVNATEGVAGETALMWAALENHASAVTLLVSRGAHLNARSRETAFPRLRFGDGIVARQMVLPRGNWTPLMYAARQNSIDAARALAAAGADLNLTDPDGTTALVFAIINGHFDLARLLVEKGANPNVADSQGMTALYAAVDMSTLDETVGRPNPKPHASIDAAQLVQALLAHGANPNLTLRAPVLERVHNDGDTNLSEGSTPLMRAAKDADVAVTRALLDAGADVNARTKTGKTPLMYAASRLGGFRGTPNRGTERDALAVVALCLDRGAAIDAMDENGQTALHLSVARGEDSLLRLLAERGANLQVKDKQGRTALDLATAGGRGSGGPNSRKAALLKELLAR
jgi:ankyrin repeat protein